MGMFLHHVRVHPHPDMTNNPQNGASRVYVGNLADRTAWYVSYELPIDLPM